MNPSPPPTGDTGDLSVPYRTDLPRQRPSAPAGTTSDLPSTPGSVATRADLPPVSSTDLQEGKEKETAGARRWMARPLTVVTIVCAAVFVLVGIGSPLLGATVLAPTDELATHAPYYDAAPTRAQTPVQNTYLDDTYTALFPGTMLYTESVRSGESANWNPYISGGVPLGAIPDYAVYSPLTLPYYVLPAWLAPAYEKLFELAVAILGTYLLLRRLNLGRPAAVLGGMIFASSGFMVAWLNFPQTRVATFIPWLFWAAERLLQRRRIVDGVVLCLPVAFMLLGGFPAVTGFALLSAVPYFLWRVLLQYRGQWGRILRLVLGAGAAVAGGVLLAAVQLLPFYYFYKNQLIEGRGQDPSQHLTVGDLITSFAPWAGGSVNQADPPAWFLSNNLIESLSYIGAAAAVLALVSVVLARSGRRALPTGAWWYFVAGSLIWLAVIYTSGPLRILQHLPPFSSNFVGRARSVLGLLLAVLAAVGFELLLRRTGRAGSARSQTEPGRLRQGLAGRPAVRFGYAVAVWLVAAVGLALVWHDSRSAAANADAAAGGGVDTRFAHLNTQVLIGLAFVAATMVAVAVLYRSVRRPSTLTRGTRLTAAVLVPALVAGQGLALVLPYYPRSDKSTFYPTTDVQTYLSQHLGDDRFAASASGMVFGADAAARLRALAGHSFINASFAKMVRAIPGNPIPYPTYILFGANQKQVDSPVMDLLGVRYFVTSPQDRVFGTPRTATGDGSTATLAPSAQVTVPVPGTGPVRAVGFTPSAAYPQASDPQSWVEVKVTDRTGATVATARRLTLGMVANKPFLVPVAAEKVSSGARLAATFTLHTPKPVQVQARAGAPAVSSVTDGDDGLALVYAGSSEIYQRTTALPRIRWASRATVVPNEQKRVQMLASGSLAANEVMLNSGSAQADGRPGTVRVDQDDNDAITANVTAQGAGYLVVADELQGGWAATVDGHPADLVPADEGVVAVEVPAGTHTVRLHYASPYHNLGLWLTALTVLLLVILAITDQWLFRRRRNRPIQESMMETKS